MTDPHLVPFADLFANPRGVAFAAFASPGQIGALLGLDPDQTASFQSHAHGHFHAMMAEARRGRV